MEEIKVGIEIEFLLSDYYKLFKLLIENNIYFKFCPQQFQGSTEEICIKPEFTVRGGIEITLPPTCTFQQLQLICNICKNATFTEKCAMHIHFVPKYESESYYKYYCKNEQDIINAAKAQGLYLNLNKSVVDASTARNSNLNIYRSMERHGTIEHRIYKATFDYDKILWAINQTKQIQELN